MNQIPQSRYIHIREIKLKAGTASEAANSPDKRQETRSREGEGTLHIPSGVRMLKRYVLRRSEGERYLKASYRSLSGQDLDCDNPSTFTAKMFERLIRINRRGEPVFSRLADKYLVREYVTAKLGPQHLVKLLWDGVDARKIPFDTLPTQYVIKTNHGSGGHVVVRGAVDRAKIIEQVAESLRQNYYWRSREYHYHPIAPRILVEEYLDDAEPSGPLDYRFWCFDGVPALIQVDNAAHTINPFYDVHWNLLDLRYRKQVESCSVAKPGNLDEMLSAASTLAAGFDFVRVDLYNIRGRVLFGELTFTPRGGFLEFQPRSWDLILGQKWKVKALPAG